MQSSQFLVPCSQCQILVHQSSLNMFSTGLLVTTVGANNWGYCQKSINYCPIPWQTNNLLHCIIYKLKKVCVSHTTTFVWNIEQKGEDIIPYGTDSTDPIGWACCLVCTKSCHKNNSKLLHQPQWEINHNWTLLLFIFACVTILLKVYMLICLCWSYNISDFNMLTISISNYYIPLRNKTLQEESSSDALSTYQCEGAAAWFLTSPGRLSSWSYLWRWAQPPYRRSSFQLVVYGT